MREVREHSGIFIVVKLSLEHTKIPSISRYVHPYLNTKEQCIKISFQALRPVDEMSIVFPLRLDVKVSLLRLVTVCVNSFQGQKQGAA